MKYNTILIRTLEVILGGLFVYAGLEKVLHPYEFAEAALAYRLLPQILIGVVVAVLPWVEIVAGLSLVTGLKRRSGLVILWGLLSVFLVLILVTMARGLKIDCGCGFFSQRQVGSLALLEDLFLLAWSAGLYWWERTAAVHLYLNFSPKTQNPEPKTPL
ncbi:MAG: MauE/DoxX family redox-associated membrane protein [Deltaproteobacteria bacterium]|jgi:putative oxidoreductase